MPLDPMNSEQQIGAIISSLAAIDEKLDDHRSTSFAQHNQVLAAVSKQESRLAVLEAQLPDLLELQTSVKQLVWFRDKVVIGTGILTAIAGLVWSMPPLIGKFIGNVLSGGHN